MHGEVPNVVFTFRAKGALLRGTIPTANNVVFADNFHSELTNFHILFLFYF